MKENSLNQEDVQSSNNARDCAEKRLKRELHHIFLNPPIFINAYLKEDNLFDLEATIQGPRGSPYECENFVLNMQFTVDYPFLSQRRLNF